jgi:hypothetical protein
MQITSGLMAVLSCTFARVQPQQIDSAFHATFGGYMPSTQEIEIEAHISVQSTEGASLTKL